MAVIDVTLIVWILFLVATDTAPQSGDHASRDSNLACELHDSPSDALSQLAEAALTTEVPVHIDEVVDRIHAL